MTFRSIKIKDDETLEELLRKERHFWDNVGGGMKLYSKGPYRKEIVRSYLVLGAELMQLPFKKGIKVLDFGLGLGRGYDALHDIGIDYYGVDISSKLKERAEKIHPKINIKVIDNIISYPDNMFDMAIADSVFTHVPFKQVKGMLLELYRVIKEGRGLLVTILDERYKGKWHGSCEIIPVLDFYNLVHEIGFNVLSIIEIPKESGYRQILFCLKKTKNKEFPLLWEVFKKKNNKGKE